MFDASVVGLLCALTAVAFYALGLWHSHHYMGGSVDASEVDRRTAPPGPPTMPDVE